MSNPPNPALTVYSLLDTNWPDGTGGKPNICPKPRLFLPYQVKRQATADFDVAGIYSTVRTEPKEGIFAAYRDRDHPVTIDVVTTKQPPAVGFARFQALIAALEYIFDLAAVRTNPPTRPSVAAGDAYNANPYAQILPDGYDTSDDKDKSMFRVQYHVILKTYWEAR